MCLTLVNPLKRNLQRFILISCVTDGALFIDVIYWNVYSVCCSSCEKHPKPSTPMPTAQKKMWRALSESRIVKVSKKYSVVQLGRERFTNIFTS